MNTVVHRGVLQRATGAAKLDVDVYEEVEADTEATGQAAAVVAVVAICSAIGGLGGGASAALGGLIAALVGWLLWAGVTYLIGDKLLGGTATWGELLRTLGFAQAPGVLYIFAGLGGFGEVLSWIVAIWLLLAGIIAIRQALDFGTGRAVVTALLGFLAYATLRVMIGLG